MFKKEILFSLALSASAAVFAETSFNTFQSDKELVSELQKGGYTFYIRHAATNHEKRTTKPDLHDCSTQRNLSPEGITFSQHLHHVLTELLIPIDKVEASPYCRTKDTARYAFGKFTVNENLAFSIKEDEKTKAQKSDVLRKMLKTAPEKGQNNAIVSHTANLKDAIDIWPKPEGVAIIIKADAQHGPKHIATIKPNEWDSLLKLK